MSRIADKRFLVVGRAGMDLYPEPTGTKIATATQFSSALGGSAANIAAGLCRQGATAALMSALSDDPVGRFCAAQLDAFGVDRSLIATSGAGTRTSLALSESRIDGHETLIYRNGASDFDLDPSLLEEIDLTVFDAVVLTGTALARQPSRDVALALINRAAAASVDVVLDLDYRPYSWSSMAEASTVYLDTARRCRIVVGNDIEFGVLWNKARATPDHALRLQADCGALCIYKMGGDGAVTFDGPRVLRTGVFPVEALKPVGAGDAFMAAFLVGWYGGAGLEKSVVRGSAAAALVVTRPGCAMAMPTPEELDAFCATRAMTPPLSIDTKD